MGPPRENPEVCRVIWGVSAFLPAALIMVGTRNTGNRGYPER
jgi:hypothetical protein